MPIQLNVLERTIFFSLNQAPAPIIDLWSAIAFRAVMTADRLGVFAALSESPAMATELAARLPADPRALGVLLLFNILHGFSAAHNQALLKKAAGALAQDGKITVGEQLAGAGGSRANRAINGLLEFSFFLTLGGQVYSVEQLSGWLQGAGFGRIRRHPLRMSDGSSLVVAER